MAALQFVSFMNQPKPTKIHPELLFVSWFVSISSSVGKTVSQPEEIPMNNIILISAFFFFLPFLGSTNWGGLLYSI